MLRKELESLPFSVIEVFLSHLRLDIRIDFILGKNRKFARHRENQVQKISRGIEALLGNKVFSRRIIAGSIEYLREELSDDIEGSVRRFYSLTKRYWRKIPRFEIVNLTIPIINCRYNLQFYIETWKDRDGIMKTSIVKFDVEDLVGIKELLNFERVDRTGDKTTYTRLLIPRKARQIRFENILGGVAVEHHVEFLSWLSTTEWNYNDGNSARAFLSDDLWIFGSYFLDNRYVHFLAEQGQGVFQGFVVKDGVCG